MRCLIKCIDVVDEPADVLIYSTNVLLNCTGGVGACLMAKYGLGFQEMLHAYLRSRDLKFAQQGAVLDLVAPRMPYRHVLHTVPCDGFYETTEGIVSTVVEECLSICQSDQEVSSVAMSALATGYGRFQFDDLFRVVATVASMSTAVASVTVCVPDPTSYDQALNLSAREGLGYESAA